MAIDWVALASVVSSGVVAAGSLVLTYRGAKHQRQHEAALAFEAKAWDEKSKTLYNVIAGSRALTDAMLSTDPRFVVLSISRAAAQLDQLVGGVEAYASPACREAFIDLRRRLHATTVPGWLHHVVSEIRMEKERAIDAMDFERAAELKSHEQTEISQAVGGMIVDQSDVKIRAERLIEHARQSIRSSDAL